LGLAHDDSAPLLVHADGSRVPSARITRLGIESNGELCKSLLVNRYTTAATKPWA